MIFTYHKISFLKSDKSTVNLWNFIRQMFEARKYKVVFLKDYDINDKNQIVLRFDD